MGVAALVAIVLAALIAIPISAFSRDDGIEPADKPSGSWREVPPAPFTPRLGSLATWTGKEAIFWGGKLPACNGYGGCGPDTPWQSQGVAFNPADQTWRRLSNAPFDADGGAPHLQIGDRFLVEDEYLRWWSFDAATDEWTRMPDPSEALVSTSVTSLGPLMYAVGNGLGDRVQAFDTDTNTWSSLPTSPGVPRLADRRLVATPNGLLAIGRSYGESPDGKIPAYRVEFFDGQGWIRLGSTIPWATQCCWHWTGDRLVVPDDAAELVTNLNNIGVPTTTLPQPEESAPLTRSWSGEVLSGPMMAWAGNVYDDRDRSIGRLGRPVGAPDDLAAAVWADGKLLVLGGQNPLGVSPLAQSETSRAWVYAPHE